MKGFAYDYSKLKGRIREKFETQKLFAKAMEMGATTLSQKLNNESDWARKEIHKAYILLGLDPGEIVSYFFAQKVHKSEHQC